MLIYSGALLLMFVFVFVAVDRHGTGRRTAKLIDEGKQIFRFDTFGDEDFWGGQLQLHHDPGRAVRRCGAWG